MNYNKSLFQGVSKKNPNKSRFNLSHEFKAAFRPGFLTPVLTLETMPGDYFSEINTEFMFRFPPMYYPAMQKYTMRADYFYVPNRILWPESVGTNIGEDTPTQGWNNWIQNNLTLDESHPMLQADMKWQTSYANNQVLAYMGVPLIDSGPNTTTTINELNALPLSAYLKIWDEYYRVTQLEPERWFGLNGGTNTTKFGVAFEDWKSDTGMNDEVYMCAPSKWEKDYFTSALPTPQIGEAVLIPSLGIEDDGTYTPQNIVKLDGTAVGSAKQLWVEGGELNTQTTGERVVLESQAQIRQLRLAETLQSYYERLIKVGNRYRDYIEGFFGHDPMPLTIDRPVLIGSKFGRVQISDVLTTANTTNSTDASNGKTGDYNGQANLYEGGGGAFNQFCAEHGWIMCILQVNPNSNYGQGIERFWRRTVQTDYPMDMFAGIGDQEILKEEVLYNAITLEAAKNNDTFGYIPRFSEMRYKNNYTVGELQFEFGLSMQDMRWWDRGVINGTDYDNVIEINTEFVNVGKHDGVSAGGNTGGHTRTSDIFRVLPSNQEDVTPVEASIFAHLFHTVIVERQLPVYSTPQMAN